MSKRKPIDTAQKEMREQVKQYLRKPYIIVDARVEREVFEYLHPHGWAEHRPTRKLQLVIDLLLNE